MENYKKTMLISPNKVKESGKLNVNVDDKAIGASIRTAQEVYLVDVIGTDLVEKLQELVYNKIVGSGSSIDDVENIAYKTLLDEYVTEALQEKTVIDLCIRLSYKVRNMGVMKNSDTNAMYSDIDDIKYVQNYLETEYCHTLNRMTEFLCKNKAAFPESKIECDCASTPKYANVNIWLG